MSLRQTRIAKDYAILKKFYQQGIIKQLKGFPGEKKSMNHLAILLEGPEGTPYHKGLFKYECLFGPTFPMDPPFFRLHTPIWHPNFWPDPSEYPGKRNICLAVLDASKKGQKDGWSPTKNTGTIIHSILAMYDVEGAYINPHDVFNKKAAQELLKNKPAFIRKARQITRKYATKKW
ncbi:MAG: ubiquitin-conjugating enzyme E2 [Promethearchaeota archaeon]